MAKVIPITERFQHFVEELQERFWGDLYGRTPLKARDAARQKALPPRRPTFARDHLAWSWWEHLWMGQPVSSQLLPREFHHG